ncbi:salicylate synthase [Kibdelosporangium aridum]|uniref:Salicylate synthase n=1 Tax=Kibdelosporangium aridum TaxID=2030 RepID=A0A428ZCF3_KIBAR|nr:salicylate synthase [Kibdelosporangium aridum]RSM85749.1 salicylate synthase [Kibdelosporangium aridum]
MSSHPRLSYHERTFPFTGDPLTTLTSLAQSDAFTDFVLYEGNDSWSLAGGVLATVVLDRTSARSTFDGATNVQPLSSDPLDAVRDLLTALPIHGWRAYGWCAFEFAYLQSGDAKDEELLHLVVPEVEIRIAYGKAELRAARLAALDDVHAALLDAVREPNEREYRVPTPADVRKSGTAEYMRLVAQTVERIRARQFDKAVVSRVVPVCERIDFAATYLAGRRANTPARSFLLSLGGVRSAGFSPEVVVRVSSDGTVMSQPLAGTRALTDDPVENARLRAELVSNPKEVYEHAISVRTACDELQRVCVEGSVVVEEFMIVRERGTVQHLGSKVTGKLPEGRSAWDAFGVVFPAVTASGIPKASANSWIRVSEGRARGLYGGAVLTVDVDGSLDAALVLRAVHHRDGQTWLQAGAGIVSDSSPEREFEETCEKLDSIARFLVPAEPRTDHVTRPHAVQGGQL